MSNQKDLVQGIVDEMGEHYQDRASEDSVEDASRSIRNPLAIGALQKNCIISYHCLQLPLIDGSKMILPILLSGCICNVCFAVRVGCMLAAVVPVPCTMSTSRSLVSPMTRWGVNGSGNRCIGGWVLVYHGCFETGWWLATCSKRIHVDPHGIGRAGDLHQRIGG